MFCMFSCLDQNRLFLLVVFLKNCVDINALFDKLFDYFLFG